MEKPEALTTLRHILPEAFAVLKRNYDVPDIYYLNLDCIDATNAEMLSRPTEVAAVSMRKLQLLNIHSPLGVRTPADVVVGLCGELVRSLHQLVRGTRDLAVEDRQVLVQAMQALQSCGVIVGTMQRPGDIVILE